MLLEGVYGNPHSSNPTSQTSTILVEDTRDHILRFFNASPEEYVVIFTQNASGALKLVGESYHFDGGRYLLTYDNHNSVNGIREYAAQEKGSVRDRLVQSLQVVFNCLLGHLCANDSS